MDDENDYFDYKDDHDETEYHEPKINYQDILDDEYGFRR